jgi:hypothetical protein
MSLGIVTLLALAALDVRWHAPDACSAPDLSLLSASESGRAEVHLTTPVFGTWVVDLTFVEPFEAARHLELATCADARRAVRALLVLGLKGADAFREAAVPLSPPPLIASEPEPVPGALSRRWALRAGALGSLLTLRATMPRFVLAGALRVGALEVELGVRTGLSEAFSSGPTTTASVTVWPVLGGELAGCFSPPLRRLRPGVCATVLVEWWQLSGAGVSNPASGSAALLAAGAQARLAYPLGAGLEVGGAAAFRGHLRRPTAEFSGVEALAAGPVSLEFGAWLGWAP